MTDTRPLLKYDECLKKVREAFDAKTLTIFNPNYIPFESCVYKDEQDFHCAIGACLPPTLISELIIDGKNGTSVNYLGHRIGFNTTEDREAIIELQSKYDMACHEPTSEKAIEHFSSSLRVMEETRVA